MNSMSLFYRLPIELRWHVYNFCTVDESDNEPNYTIFHWLKYPKEGRQQTWLDAAFPHSSIVRYDGHAITNLFIAFPKLWQDDLQMSALVFQPPSASKKASPQQVTTIKKLLRHFAATEQKYVPHLAIDMRSWADSSIADLLRFVWGRVSKWQMRFTVRTRWESQRVHGHFLRRIGEAIERYRTDGGGGGDLADGSGRALLRVFLDKRDEKGKLDMCRWYKYELEFLDFGSRREG